MGVFYVLLFVPILMQHCAVRGLHMNYEKRNKAAVTFFFVWLTVLIALRHESIGNDTSNYIRFFKAFSRMDWQGLRRENMENGYRYLNKLISLVSREPQFYLAAVAVLVSIPSYSSFRRLCTDAALAVVLYCTMSTFVMMFSGIRQMISMAIGFVAYEFARKKKLVPCVLLVLLAMSFHASAFMLAFMYPLYHARITKRWLYVVVPVLGLCFVYNRQIFGVMTLILERYTEYNTEIEPTGAYTMLVLLGLFCVFCFLIPDERKLDDETIGLRNFLLLTFALQMFAPLHTLAMRMGYYYMIFIPLLLPRVIECRSRRWSQVAIWGRHVMVTFFLLYFFARASAGGSLHVFPYHFFWERV